MASFQDVNSKLCRIPENNWVGVQERHHSSVTSTTWCRGFTVKAPRKVFTTVQPNHFSVQPHTQRGVAFYDSQYCILVAVASVVPVDD